jgi:uncharacterized protein YukE
MSDENDARIDSEIEQLKVEVKEMSIELNNMVGHIADLKDGIQQLKDELKSEIDELHSHSYSERQDDIVKNVESLREIQEAWMNKYPGEWFVNEVR